MLTARGWWLFLAILTALSAGLLAAASTLVLIALTLLTWFLTQWLVFAVRVRRLHGALSVARRLVDERGSVETLWARIPARVEVQLLCHRHVSLSFVAIVDRLPPLAQLEEGANFAAGPVSRDQALEATYTIECRAPGLLRFDGLRVQTADLHGFFAHSTFVRAVKIYRVLPALANARGQIPSAKRHNLIPLLGTHPHRRAGTGSEL